MLKIFALDDMRALSLVCRTAHDIVARRLCRYRRLFIKYAPTFAAQFRRQLLNTGLVYKQRIITAYKNNSDVPSIAMAGFLVVFDFILFITNPCSTTIVVNIYHLDIEYRLGCIVHANEWSPLSNKFYLKLNLYTRFNPIPVNTNDISFKITGIADLNLIEVHVICGSIVSSGLRDIIIYPPNALRLLTQPVVQAE